MYDILLHTIIMKVLFSEAFTSILFQHIDTYFNEHM